MQINRLFEMVYLLLEHKAMTAKELAEHFEVSVRTIYRDVDILSTANIPIYTSKGKGGGIHLLDNFVLDKSILSEEEQNQILFALQSFNKVTPQEEKNVLEKMSMLFSKDTTDWIAIDFSDWGKDNLQSRKFNQIKKAILSSHVIRITYYNSYGEETIREIEPLQIWFKDKAWYVKAYCKEKEDYRIFKIARIKQIEEQEETFQRQLPKEIEKREEPIKTIQLELEISKEMSYRVYDEFWQDGIVEKENGDFIITVEYPENDWVYGYLLSFGEQIKVISPKYVKDILKEKIEKSLKNYQ